MKHSTPAWIGLMLLAAGLAACTITEVSPPDGDPLFLVHKPVVGERAVMQALYKGSVIEQEGCLRLGDEPDGHTVVWPPGFSLTRRGTTLTVRDERGSAVGRIGDPFRLGGGGVSTLWEDGPVAEIVRTIALEQCPGRYWIVGEIPDRE